MKQYSLRKGDKGQEVRRLQERLNTELCVNLDTDGVFGAKTESAVRDYQKSKGLAVDGIAGNATLTALGIPVLFGFDISHHNKVSDWGALCAPSSIAVVKATEGVTFRSKAFEPYSAEITKQGVQVRTCYHFATLRNAPEKEAEWYCRQYLMGVTKGWFNGLPVLDLEANTSKSPKEIVAWADAWMRRTKELTGQTPILYTYGSYINHKLKGGGVLTQYPLWVARYKSPTAPDPEWIGNWSEWLMWQYWVGTQVPGMGGRRLDQNWVAGGQLSRLKRV